jgi:hypothetical protein
MRTIKKLGICALMIFSFTACYPFMMHGESGGHGRYYYNNHNYNSGREYRQARRQGSVQVRIDASSDDNHRENR